MFSKVLSISIIFFCWASISVDAQSYVITTAYSDSKCGEIIGGNVILNNFCTPVYYANGLTKYILTNCSSTSMDTYQCNNKECTEECFKYSAVPTTSCSLAPDQSAYYELTCSTLFPSIQDFDFEVEYYDQPNCNGTIYYWSFGTDKACVNGEYFSCTESSILLFYCEDPTCQDASTCSLLQSSAYGCSPDSLGSIRSTCF